MRILLKTDNLTIGYRRSQSSNCSIAGPINVSLQEGQLVCLLGANGSGKSTFIRTVAGLQTPLNGNVELLGQQLSHLKPATTAKMLSLVLTDSVKSGNLDVLSLVSLGRYPHTGWFGQLNENDREIVDRAIASAKIEPFIHRKVSQLSDGECQKVMLARALAQDTPLIILDEPTAHLDLPSRIELMRLLHQLVKETGKSILLSTHELDLALQAADEIWLLKPDGTLETGTPEDMVLSGTFESAFNKAGIQFDRASGNFIIHPPGENLVSFKGEGIAAFWTRRALTRNGFQITDSNADCSIELQETNQGTYWLIKKDGTEERCASIETVLYSLKS